MRCSRRPTASFFSTTSSSSGCNMSSTILRGPPVVKAAIVFVGTLGGSWLLTVLAAKNPLRGADDLIVMLRWRENANCASELSSLLFASRGHAADFRLRRLSPPIPIASSRSWCRWRRAAAPMSMARVLAQEMARDLGASSSSRTRRAPAPSRHAGGRGQRGGRLHAADGDICQRGQSEPACEAAI